MAQRIIVVGGGAAGMGAAGAAQGTDPDAQVTVVTSFEDAAYSPCGIPYVHGKEIPDFDRLFMATKQHYIDQGLDIRYETTVTSVDTKARRVSRSAPARCSATTRWCWPRASSTPLPACPAKTAARACTT